jgi:hypothetical protein
MNENEYAIARRDARITELEEEADALRQYVADHDGRKRQRATALLCLAGVLMAASAGPPLLVILALVAASAGIVTMVGDR